MLFDRFDEIRVINLASRRDRRRQMKAELNRFGLDLRDKAQFFNAVRPAACGAFTSIGAHGVYLSHLSILKGAAQRGASVLILEDDCDFVGNAKDFDTGTSFDLFYGGYQASDPVHLERSDIIGAHCMGFSAAIVAPLADYLESLLGRKDQPPIDGAYVWFRRAHPAVLTVFARPPIAHQRPSRTDIAELRVFDRLPVVRDIAQAARTIRRAIRRASPRQH